MTDVAYAWSHPESGEQSGLLVLGSAGDPPGVVAMWSDTFHQSPAAGWLTGIAIDTSDPARLLIRMDNHRAGVGGRPRPHDSEIFTEQA